MRDVDRLRNKAMEILRANLEEEEMAYIKVQVGKSAEDIRKEVIYKDTIDKAYKKLMQEKATLAKVEMKEGINALAKVYGLEALPVTSFTISVYEYFMKKGSLTTKQVSVLQTIELASKKK